MTTDSQLRHPRTPSFVSSVYKGRAHRLQAMTLLEVMLSVFVLGVALIGSITTLIQTHKATAAAIAESTATTIIQGYAEQIKSLDLVNLIPAVSTTTSVTLLTRKDSNATPIRLQTTPLSVTYATLTGSPPGTTPTGAVDNLQAFDMDSTTTTSSTTWAAVWPNKSSTQAYPSTSPGSADLRLNVWVQVSDLTPTENPKTKAYGILLVYTWQFNDGRKLTYRMKTLRMIRSTVTTY